jgi:flagellar FliL protein
MLGKKKKKKEDAEAAPEADEDGAPKPEDAANENAEGGEGETPAKKKMSGKKLVLFFILPAVLVLGGGGAAAYLLLFNGGHPEQHANAGHGREKGADHSGESTPGPNGTTITQGEAGIVFVTMPEMLVNISGPDGRPSFLKLKLTIEAPSNDAAASLTTQLPRVSDEFNGFLRELRTDDLAGSAGAYRLRLELLRRVNLAIAPAHANAVLIEEMMVQ